MEAEELKPEALTCPHCQHVLGGAVAYCPFCGEPQPLPASPESADTSEFSSATDAATATSKDSAATTLEKSGAAQTSIGTGVGGAGSIEEKGEEPPALPKNDSTIEAPEETGGGAKSTGENAGHGESTIRSDSPGRRYSGGWPAPKNGDEGGEQPPSAPGQAKPDAEQPPKPSRLPRLIIIGIVCLLAVWGIAKIRQTVHDTTEQRYTLALRAYQDKRLTEAKRLLEELLHDNPGDTKARDLNDQITATQQRHEDMYRRAMRELKSGRKNQARKQLQTIVREDGDNTKARDLLEKYWLKREPEPTPTDSNRPPAPTAPPTPESVPAPTPEPAPAQTSAPAPLTSSQPAPATTSRHNKQGKSVDCQALEQKVKEDIKGYYVLDAGNLIGQAIKAQCPQTETLRRAVEDAKSNIPNWQWKNR